jgi:hypothetical protein
LRVGSHYKINGCGDLTWNAATDLDGYGFCIQYEESDYKRYLRDSKINTILND